MYTYAVAGSLDPATIDGLRGIDGAPVHLVRHRDVVAVVSPMSTATMDEAALRARLETLEELEALARAHHAVVAAVATHTVTLPFRLATIHNGAQRVVEMLGERYGELRAMLDRLAGRVELGVKVYAEVPAAGTPAREPAATDEGGSATAGRDYLRRRRRQRDERDVVWHRAATTAERLDAALAVDRRQHRPQSGWLAGAHGENVLNAAYLVEAGGVPEFAAQARRLVADTPGVRVEVTGPWAPYSFASERSSDAAGVVGGDEGDQP